MNTVVLHHDGDSLIVDEVVPHAMGIGKRRIITYAEMAEAIRLNCLLNVTLIEAARAQEDGQP